MPDLMGSQGFVGQALGSTLRLQLTDLDARSAAAAWDAVTATFDAVDRAMSSYRADSDVSAPERGRGAAWWVTQDGTLAMTHRSPATA